MTRGIIRKIFADAVEIRTAPTNEALPFPAHQRQNLKDFARGFNSRVDENLTSQRHVACLGQKGEGKSRSQAEAVLAITPAAIEPQLEIGYSVGLGRQKRKVRHPLKQSRRRRQDQYATQATIGQLEPLLFCRSI